MAESSSKSLIAVGKIVGVFGIKGWLKVKSYTAPQENIVSYGAWQLNTQRGERVVEVDAWQIRPQGMVCHLRGIDDRDAAEALGRPDIAVPVSRLKSLPQGEYYWHQLIGLSVISEFEGAQYKLGAVVDLLETGANDVLVVRGDEHSIDQRERLVPYLPDLYVRSIDLDTAEMRVEWDPEF